MAGQTPLLPILCGWPHDVYLIVQHEVFVVRLMSAVYIYDYVGSGFPLSYFALDNDPTF